MRYTQKPTNKKKDQNYTINKHAQAHKSHEYRPHRRQIGKYQCVEDATRRN